MSPTARLWSAVTALLLLAAILQFSGLAPVLRYSRDAIAAGEIWRLITAHFLHLGAAHFALNAMGTVLAAALVGAQLRPLAWAWVWLACALSVSGGLWWLQPEVGWYVGMSGVLHGLIVAGAVTGLGDYRERLFAAAILAAITAKLGWEQWSGAMPGTAALAGGSVITEAHLYGAVGGLLAGTVILAMHRLRPIRR
ncbi:MAG: rhombosortase [Halofilum sp. (in: g-proteobacteria)]|nr:rhombosortase [Halofilum sp. (in: g-proteobacteria)]